MNRRINAMRTVVGVIPAAGYATRLGARAGSKEMILVRGRPMIDYLLERFDAAGAGRIRLTTRAAKTDLVEYATRRGLEVCFGDPPHVGASIALALDGLDPGDLVLVGFPDTIWAPVDGFAQLLPLLDVAPVAVGLFTTSQPERCDVAIVGSDGRVTGIVTKPARPPSDLIYGALAGRVDALGDVGGHPEPGRLIDRLARRSPLPAARLGRLIDLGTSEALAAADRDPIWAELPSPTHPLP